MADVDAMEQILRKLNLEMLLPRFQEEKITPDIVSKISLYEPRSLGITDRSLIMKLRIECINYGGMPLNRELWKRTFQIAYSKNTKPLFR